MNITAYFNGIYRNAEPADEATVKDFLIVRRERRWPRGATVRERLTVPRQRNS